MYVLCVSVWFLFLFSSIYTHVDSGYDEFSINEREEEKKGSEKKYRNATAANVYIRFAT